MTMKAVFFVCSVLALFILFVGPSPALMGVNDNVPGCDVLVPFFLVSMPGFGQMNTLISITETNKAPVTFYCRVFDKDGVLWFNMSIPLSMANTFNRDVLSIINMMSALEQRGLEVDLDEDGINDHWAGFMVFLSQSNPRLNQVTGTLHLIEVTGGINCGINLPVREYHANITDVNLLDPLSGSESFSANALFRAEQYIELQGTTGTVSDPSYLRLLPRYSIWDSISTNYFFIWSSAPCGILHVIGCNSAGNCLSFNIALNHHLNIINVRELLPMSLLYPYPVEGWVNIRMPDMFGQGFDVSRQMLGYSFSIKTPFSACGDVNLDGQVTITDAMFISQFLVGNRSSICSPIDYSFSLTEMQREAGID
jgi:hypothetical protein